MKLRIFGASGSGVTTLGAALAGVRGWPYVDSDASFWQLSAPTFTVRRPASARDAALHAELSRHPSWILGGSIVGWGTPWLAAFDLMVFLWLPPSVRLARLRQREHARYGDAIFTSPARAEQYQNFLAWAAGYDDSSTGGTRTPTNHTAWLSQFTCPIRELRGDHTVAQRVRAVQGKLRELGFG